MTKILPMALEKIALAAITKKGAAIAFKIKRAFPKSRLYLPAKGELPALTRKLFAEYEKIIFCMALGIVVRVIAPYLKDKFTDPAVVVVDEGARFAISALSGHEGGANLLAIKIGNILGAEPVITTASESAKKLVIGIGCRRGIKKDEVIRAIEYALSRAGCSIEEVRVMASIDLKRDERGLQKAGLELGIPFKVIAADQIKNFSGSYHRSPFVKEKIGVEGVSEPCALISARRPKLILPKTKVGRVTVAIARES